ncbi:hypothetical protein HMPREF1531_01050 [Propionibacterium sp. oral taxon 192 str. F0372]|uniref:hypothetical protein n=1 Tax=Propionibacterium sp. oral taxon 192 TaxID=671222 RepID=UPI0003544D81|nr:hypothetical protein [Propionibacterium sp. oral taxon 192]EPH05621.1 hypothetical protein HMPREF1531_01050 [Propionibacterium sp. oral taxon 192 str. F0372]
MTKNTDPEWDARVALSYEREARIPILRDTPGDEARDELLAMLDDIDMMVVERAATILAARDVDSLDSLMEIWDNTNDGTMRSGFMRNGITQLGIDGAPLREILDNRMKNGRPAVQRAAKSLMQVYGYLPYDTPTTQSKPSRPSSPSPQNPS